MNKSKSIRTRKSTSRLLNFLRSPKGFTLVALLVLLAGGFFVAAKLQQVSKAAPGPSTYGYIKICNSVDGYTDIIQINAPVQSVIPNRSPYNCYKEYVPAGGVRVDTDPYGPSHSYKIKPIGTGASGEYGPCHYNSDNHSSDPPNPGAGRYWVIYYKNYNRGNCTD